MVRVIKAENIMSITDVSNEKSDNPISVKDIDAESSNNKSEIDVEELAGNANPELFVLETENYKLKKKIDELNAIIEEDRKRHEESIKNIRNNAYEEGLELAKDEYTRSMQAEFSTISAMLKNICTKYKEELSNTKDDVIDITFTSVTKIVATKYSKNEIENIVNECIDKYLTTKNITVYLSEYDYSIFDLHIDKDLNIQFAIDNKISAGGCIVDTGIERLDSRLDTKLEIFKNLLLEARNDNL